MEVDECISDIGDVLRSDSAAWLGMIRGGVELEILFSLRRRWLDGGSERCT